MADNRDNLLNLAVLQRLDSTISSIVDSASQVALYKFSSENNEWEKTEIEGTLFVYMRSTKPYYGFIVMNRVNTTNFFEPVTSELEFQVQTPFLLYRNGRGHIHGIWFYEQEHCKKIGILLMGLLQVTMDKKSRHLEKPRQPQQHKNNANNLDKMDIMSLLTRAQEEYDKQFLSGSKSPAKVDSGPQQSGILKPTPVRANGLKLANGSSVPITVDKLFAQVGDGKHVFNNRNAKPCGNLNRNRSYSAVTEKHLPKEDVKHDTEDILQKLLSNTVSDTAETGHNERVHRARSATYSSQSFSVNDPASVEQVEQDLKKKLNMLPKKEPTAADMKTRPYFRSESLQDKGTVSRSKAVDIPILTPAMLELSSSLPTSSETQFKISTSQENTGSNAFVASSFPLSMIPKPMSPTPLLSPMDFKVSIKNSSSSLDESPPSPPELRTSLVNNNLHCCGEDTYNDELLLPHSLVQSSKKPFPSPLGVTPLTKNQLREALGYMIQNDEEFITQLHECYLKSLKSHLNSHKSS